VACEKKKMVKVEWLLEWMEEKATREEGRERHEYGERRGTKEINGEGRRRRDATTID